MPRPNLFIIGAAKSGTTSLHNYLGMHPQIFMSAVKEAGFFIDHREQTRPPFPKGHWNDLGLYLELFSKAGDALYLGESTMGYSWLPQRTGVPKRINEFNPQARFIYVMRDPVERAISHYWWNVWREGETRDLNTAIRNDPLYRDVSNYAMQLEPYLEIAGRERVKTLTLEELKANPTRTLQDIFSWLGVDASFVPANLRQRMNVTDPVVNQLRSPLLRWMQRFRYSKFWNAVGPFMPRFIRVLGHATMARPVDKSKVSVQEAIDYLRPIQQEQTIRLSQMLGREFPEWKTLYATSQPEPDRAGRLAPSGAGE